MTNYEWDIETVDTNGDEILDHNHADKLADFAKRGHTKLEANERLVLVRDSDQDERTWAYITDAGEMPSHFEDAYQAECTSVPARFIAEFAKHGKVLI